ncbi:MAG: hypothetical protein M3P53_01445 [Actinomycetota bacterium]|nr:hypothetical protein [Actinomycetota bacterium]
MPRYIAHLTFEFDAPSIEDGGRRIRELAPAAEAVDFELEGVGKVEEAPRPEDDPSGWTGYGPIGA